MKENKWLKPDAKFNLSSIKTELKMCLIVPSYKNHAHFRIEHNLNSIFMQNYKNYKVVITDDASPDNSIETKKRNFEFYKIDPKKYVLLSNEKSVTTKFALPIMELSFLEEYLRLRANLHICTL